MGALYVLCRWYYVVVVPVTPVSLRRWENPEDMDIQEVSGEFSLISLLLILKTDLLSVVIVAINFVNTG